MIIRLSRGGPRRKLPVSDCGFVSNKCKQFCPLFVQKLGVSGVDVGEDGVQFRWPRGGAVRITEVLSKLVFYAQSASA